MLIEKRPTRRIGRHTHLAYVSVDSTGRVVHGRLACDPVQTVQAKDVKEDGRIDRNSIRCAVCRKHIWKPEVPTLHALRQELRRWQESLTALRDPDGDVTDLFPPRSHHPRQWPVGTAAIRTGEQIHLTWTENCSDKVNPGWVIHRVDASFAGETIGYLKVSYIPASEMDRIYPTILHWLCFLKGHVRLLTTSSTRLAEALALMGTEWVPSDFDAALARMSEEEKEALMLRELRRIHHRFGEEYAHFRVYFCNRPLVDYVWVEPQWRGRGVAGILYRRAASVLAAHYGLRLYRGMTNHESAALWEHFAAAGLVETEDHPLYRTVRMYLKTTPPQDAAHKAVVGSSS